MQSMTITAIKTDHNRIITPVNGNRATVFYTDIEHLHKGIRNLKKRFPEINHFEIIAEPRPRDGRYQIR